jgi:hypothetical protein
VKAEEDLEAVENKMHPSFEKLSKKELLKELEFQAELTKAFSKRNEQLITSLNYILNEFSIALGELRAMKETAYTKAMSELVSSYRRLYGKMSDL